MSEPKRMTAEDFKVGDRVVHDNLGDGDVTDVSDGKVTVKFFDTFKTVGIYDGVWFGMYKLENLTAKSEGRIATPKRMTAEDLALLRKIPLGLWGRGEKDALFDHIEALVDQLTRERDTAREEGLEEAAKIADEHYNEMYAAARTHKPETPSRDRCNARARSASQIADYIRTLKPKEPT